MKTGLIALLPETVFSVLGAGLVARDRILSPGGRVSCTLARDRILGPGNRVSCTFARDRILSPGNRVSCTFARGRILSPGGRVSCTFAREHFISRGGRVIVALLPGSVFSVMWTERINSNRSLILAIWMRIRRQLLNS